MQDKSSLRSELRQSRRQLSSFQQHQAAESLSRLLLKQPQLQQAKHIALYWPYDGEISPLPLLKRLQQLGKQVYLPVVKPKRQMEFKPALLSQTKKNRYGIPEPVTGLVKPVKGLDVILMPLVGFDEQGGRLGMGGGYYDRVLAFKCRQRWNKKPLLIGLAHELQQVDRLPLEGWDVPMAAIATDKRFIAVL
ncbi:MAG: 5-formyltetrahydrofolate cyclo-ligase [Pseudomonadales bacterium]|nr:5-formyltetrahydrofolate cyclo-ligase [Pseudomonadales bacterium]